MYLIQSLVGGPPKATLQHSRTGHGRGTGTTANAYMCCRYPVCRQEPQKSQPHVCSDGDAYAVKSELEVHT
ncbi:hypothetical protein SCLCIDRAFT_1213530 [Scleroderma citrinum Foug A]|uniref:Uncharacterized protein n=1 Tax=Scleroderma citrinum Foug A TaxID=1036808 RepID=A0A0C3E6T5_9AGAM|nr:hypothetical protein SCLCIDRAFT_1213530 [Scleroderma citrinum Foug A]